MLHPRSGPLHGLHVLDLTQTAGHDALLRILRVCDAVVERLGLSYSRLRAARPDIVLVSISNYGRRGSLRDHEATELTVFAFVGRMAATGVKPRPPVRLLEGSSEYLAGVTAAGAALVALHGRDRDGMGDHLDIPISHTVLGLPPRGLCLWSYSGVNVERPDTPHALRWKERG